MKCKYIHVYIYHLILTSITFIYIGNEIQLLVGQFSSPKTLYMYSQNMYDNCSISFFDFQWEFFCLNLNVETWEHKIITVKDK